MLWPRNSYSKCCIVYLNSLLHRLCSLPFPLCVTLPAIRTRYADSSSLTPTLSFMFPSLTVMCYSPLSDLVAFSSHTDSSSYMDSLHGLIFTHTASLYSWLFMLTSCLWPTYMSLFLLTMSMNFFVFPYFAESFALMVLATLLGLLRLLSAALILLSWPLIILFYIFGQFRNT